MSKSDIYIRPIMTYEDYPHFGRVKTNGDHLAITNPLSTDVNYSVSSLFLFV